MSTRESISATVQLLFLFDVSSILDIVETSNFTFDKEIILQTIRSIILQVSLLINSSVISIISKAIDLRISPPILRYRSKSFHPIHSTAADLNNLFAYINSMIPQTQEPSLYTWDVVKLYLLQALSDYPWNNSQSELSYKFIFLFSNCLNSLAEPHLHSILPSLASSKSKLFIVSNKNYQLGSNESCVVYLPFSSLLSHSWISSINISFRRHISSTCIEKQYQHHLKQIIRQHEKICNSSGRAGKSAQFEIVNLSSGAIDGSDDSQSSYNNNPCQMAYSSVDNSLRSLNNQGLNSCGILPSSDGCLPLKSVFYSIPGVLDGNSSDESFILFLFFYFLFNEGSKDSFFECFSSSYNINSNRKSLLFEFYTMPADTRSILSDILLSNDKGLLNGNNLKTALSCELFSTITIFISYFKSKPVLRSDSFLRILFIASPIGWQLLSTYENLYPLLDELTLSFLISDALLSVNPHSTIKNDAQVLIQLLNHPENRWAPIQLSQMKEALLDILDESSELSFDDSELILSNGNNNNVNSDDNEDAIIINSSNISNGNHSSQSQSLVSSTSSFRYFLFQNNSSITPIEVQQSQGTLDKSSTSSLNFSSRILVQDTPTKPSSGPSTPKCATDDDEQNVIIVQTPKKFISCKRALQY